ncbi:hypothetical protein BD324DRAFT_245855 [Kockovaella imperatae]|uniref:Uncharacterized protein n=1 Tax=Kockovaella imperatae TaxID=4999 RepID=A0A1Y1URZ6_9TREE|nr:hypothetical protein BD324DRAFT_245855 [Kockovaella imperatae]ORX39955.1 hypothetical protein BD324DRAFT_245855 [Kockovaella imperatae]
MSLHRYVVPPPLALAIEPAPPPKPHKDHKPDSKDSKDPQKDDKPAAAGKAGGTNDEDKHKNQIAEAGVKAGDIDKEEKPKAPLQTPTPEDSPVVPPSPGSMIPEPGTPRLGAEPPKDVAPVPGPREAVKPAGQQEMPKDRLSEEVKSPTTEDQQEVEQHIKVEPLWLLTPAPHRPLRTRLQLNPDKPYPPINTDPRGAYFKYARGVQAEWILIDVTKDGWLVDQWREKPEREALARLKGEADKQRDREVEALERRSKIRQVPKTSEEILLHLWNDLAEAPSYEVGSPAGEQVTNK